MVWTLKKMVFGSKGLQQTLALWLYGFGFIA